MPTVLISIALLVVIFFAVRSIVKSRGSCSGCNGCKTCSAQAADANGEAAIGCPSCGHCEASHPAKE